MIENEMVRGGLRLAGCPVVFSSLLQMVAYLSLHKYEAEKGCFLKGATSLLLMWDFFFLVIVESRYHVHCGFPWTWPRVGVERDC